MANLVSLLERDAELTAIEALVADAAAGAGGLIVIEGLAGIGKTRLLESALELAAVREMTVLRATASELESEFAFGLARGLFERSLAGARPAQRTRLLDGIAARAPSLLGLEHELAGVAAAPASAFEAVHALYWLTANMATARPLLLAVDDAHWADAGSLRFLHYLARRVGELPVALLVTTRPVQLTASPQLLGSLLALVDSPLEPAPMTERAVSALVRETLDANPDPTFVAACLRATNGNAFLLTELLRTLRIEGVHPDARSAASVSETAPDALRRRITTQIASLEPAAGALARTVAVLGEADLPRAAAHAGIELALARKVARTLEQASLFAGGSPLRFTHPILAAAVVTAIPPRELAEAHAGAARQLAADGAAAGIVAAHLLRSEPAADGWTVATLRRAAADAGDRGAPETAVAYLRRAVAEPPLRADKAELLLELGMAETRMRAFDAAVPTLQEGLAIEPGAETAAALAVALSLAFHLSGHYTNAIGVLHRTRLAIPEDAHAAQLTLDRYLGALAVLDPGWRATIAGQITAWQQAAQEGRLRDPALLALVAGMAIGAGMPASKWLPLVEVAAADPELYPFESATDVNSWAFGWVATSLEWGDRIEESHRLLTSAIAEGRRRGDATRLALFITYRARTSYRLGLLRAAESDCRAAVEFSGGLETTAAFPFVLFDILVERGELAEADRLLETVPDEGSHQHRAIVSLMRGRVGLAAGRHESALGDLMNAGEALEAIEFRHPSLVPWRALAATAAHVLGRTELARRLAEEDLAISRACEAPSAEGRALRISALVGDPEDALAYLELSCSILAGSSARLDHAYSLVELGSALLREGRLDEAREQLRQGLDTAHDCGATVLVDRARRELISSGARPRRLATTGVQALTPAELQVASLAGDGLANREIAQSLFVTLKTVEQHLSHAYAKLGIAGRGELTDALSPSAALARI